MGNQWLRLGLLLCFQLSAFAGFVPLSEQVRGPVCNLSYFLSSCNVSPSNVISTSGLWVTGKSGNPVLDSSSCHHAVGCPEAWFEFNAFSPDKDNRVIELFKNAPQFDSSLFSDIFPKLLSSVEF